MFDRMLTTRLGNQMFRAETLMFFTSESTGIAISWFVELLFVVFFIVVL